MNLYAIAGQFAGGPLEEALVSFGLGGTVVLCGAAISIAVRRRESLTVAESVSYYRRDLRRRAAAASGAFRMVLPIVEILAPAVRHYRLDPLRDYVQDPYIEAGCPGGLEDDEVVALGGVLGALFAMFFGLLLGLAGGPALVGVGLLGLPVGFMAVVASLKSKAEIRRRRIGRAMPYVLDLLVLMLRSGCALRVALGRVVGDYADHPLGEELGQVLADVEMGLPRRDAFLRLQARVKLDELTQFADTLVQAEELGWPLAETLERLADRMNIKRSLNAQESAGTAGVLVMLPSTLILGAAVLLLFGPMLVRIMRNGVSLQ